MQNVEVADNLQKLLKEVPKEVTLVAVSKTKPVSLIQQAYDLGHRVFGENKVQELVEKHQQMPKDIQWHMIGHLQRNKVKYIAPFVSLIHAVDSERLLHEINKRAASNNRVISCLLQVHIAEEEQKFGFDTEELTQLLDQNLLDELKHVEVKGLMGMATFTENQDKIKEEFAFLKNLYQQLKEKYNLPWTTLSMGMSGDYPLAIDEGSNMVRIGSLIFGKRVYN